MGISDGLKKIANGMEKSLIDQFLNRLEAAAKQGYVSSPQYAEMYSKLSGMTSKMSDYQLSKFQRLPRPY